MGSCRSQHRTCVLNFPVFRQSRAGAFTEAVDEIERFLIPFDCSSMLSAAVQVAAGAHVEAALQRHIGLTVFGLAKLKIIVHST